MSHIRNNPLVSIIIPIFNSERHLTQCLRSVMDQSYQNQEVICVNDGSTDSSRDILSHFARAYRNLIVINQENQGVSAARNAGLDEASGRFVVFVDSDDWIAPLLVQRFVESLPPDADLLISGDSRANSYHGDAEIRRFLYSGLRSASINPPWGKLYRRSIIERAAIRFDMGVSLGEDLLFNLEYIDNLNSIITITDKLYYNRMVPGSLTRSYRHNKYQELRRVHETVRRILGPTSGELEAVLNYLKIKSLISCCNTFYSPGSPLSDTQARGLTREIEKENPKLFVRVGDFKMRAIGWTYRLLGLRLLSKIVRSGKSIKMEIAHRT